MKLIICVISFIVPAIIFIEVRTQQLGLIGLWEDRTQLIYLRGSEAETSNKRIRSTKNSCRGAIPCQSTTKDNCTEDLGIVSIEKGTEQIQEFKEYTRITYANGSEAEDVNRTIKSIKNPSQSSGVTPCPPIIDNCPEAGQCSVHSDDFLFRPDFIGHRGCSSRRSNSTCFINQTTGVGWGAFYVAIDPEEIPYIEIFNFTIYGPTGLIEWTRNLNAYTNPNSSGIARTLTLAFNYVFPSPLPTPTLFRFTLRANETDKFYNQYPYNIACFEKRFMTAT